MSVNQVALPLDSDARAVFEGLSSRPKQLPPRLFYDEAGSALFEQITELPEYYLTATEQAIFERHAGAMVEAAGESASIVELGAGTAKKTVLVLRAALERQPRVRFIPIDVSGSALEVACRRVRRELPRAEVHPLVLDYTQRLSALERFAGPRLVLYIGSSIGNFEPMESAAMLHRLRLALEPGDALLLGTDLRKPERILLPAYDDAAGVTAAFNRNVLVRINREFAADFRPELFAHRALWNAGLSRMEMHLESTRAQQVRIRALDLTVSFERGERIHTENSYKFTPAMVGALASNSGFRVEQCWQDDRGWFAVTLLRA
jgi:dimethylhistidine N-methyltransferase